MGKIFWMMAETTGYSTMTHDITHLGYIIEIGGEVKEKGELWFQPFGCAAEFDLKMMERYGNDENNVFVTPHQEPVGQLKILRDLLLKYIDKEDRSDKYVLAGFQFIGIQSQFLKRAFAKAKITAPCFFTSCFFHPLLDVSTVVAQELILRGVTLYGNHSLKSVATYLKIPLTLVDAYKEIIAAREIYYKLLELRRNGNHANL